MAFYHYSQNNSGGDFKGAYHHIVIEANSPHEADARATREAGMYFDGVSAGRDCPCCGDRWYTAYGTGYLEPMVYGEKVADRKDDRWGLLTLVLYADGRRVKYGKKTAA